MKLQPINHFHYFSDVLFLIYFDPTEALVLSLFPSSLALHYIPIFSEGFKRKYIYLSTFCG